MKLAILALCRLDKNVTIFSSEKIYSFKIKEDNNFIKNNKPQKCLHCKIGKNFDSNMKNIVKVIIENINENEWGNEIDNFLWLLGEDIDIINSVDNNNNEIGKIIYEDHLKNKIFVKGIYIQELDEKKDNFIPGFEANLKLDRDRNFILSQYQLKTIISKIFSGIINKNIDYFKDMHLNKENNKEKNNESKKKSKKK